MLGVPTGAVPAQVVEFEPVGRQKEMKAVLYFEGKKKGVILNKTNATKITQLAGSPDTDDWQGFRIKLYATETEFGGETVECIRIKAAPALGNGSKPKPKPEPVEDADDDPVPF